VGREGDRGLILTLPATKGRIIVGVNSCLCRTPQSTQRVKLSHTHRPPSLPPSLPPPYHTCTAPIILVSSPNSGAVVNPAICLTYTPGAATGKLDPRNGRIYCLIIGRDREREREREREKEREERVPFLPRAHLAGAHLAPAGVVFN